MKAAEWIDRLKAEREWTSDYRVAKEIAVSHSTLSRYRNKPESTMDDDTAVKVAEALDLEPVIVVLDQVTERTRSVPARSALSGLLARLTGKARGGGRGTAGKGPVDITSAASTAPDDGGDPAGNATGIHIVSPRPRSAPLQLMARALAQSLSSYRPALAGA